MTAKKKPFTLLYSISSFVLDLLASPRATELVVRTLTRERLEHLGSADGTLPYHTSEITALVWELKYRANARAATLAGQYLSELLLAEVTEQIGVPLLIPIPMHAARRRERGYNQTEMLCEAAIAVFSHNILDYDPSILERIRPTLPQQGLARHKRLKNIKNSMKVKNPSRVAGRVCIVVDDVSTTGATFREATRALLAAGAREVVCLPLARS